MAGAGWVKGRFHEPLNHDGVRDKPADEWKLTKKTIDRCDEIKTLADECLWSFHCTVLTDYSFADELKPMSLRTANKLGIHQPTSII